MSARGAGGRLSASDEALWRRVARTVRPMPGREPAVSAVVQATVPSPQATPPSPPSPPRPPIEIGARRPSEPTARLARPQVDPKAADRSGERKVRRGRLDPQSRLDLHGHTHDAARAVLMRFLHAAAGRGERCVLVITGKGRMQEDGERFGVLRAALPGWLDPLCPRLVAGYAPAHRRHGGEGAFYVFLKAGED